MENQTDNNGPVDEWLCVKPVAKGAYKVISIEVLMSAGIQGPYICTFPLHGMITIVILT